MVQRNAVLAGDQSACQNERSAHNASFEQKQDFALKAIAMYHPHGLLHTRAVLCNARNLHRNRARGGASRLWAVERKGAWAQGRATSNQTETQLTKRRTAAEPKKELAATTPTLEPAV
eukprot:1182593-Pleurochrysis_carterae.AAC.1